MHATPLRHQEKQNDASPLALPINAAAIRAGVGRWTIYAAINSGALERKKSRATDDNSRRRSASLARLAPALCRSPVMSARDMKIEGPPPETQNRPSTCERGRVQSSFDAGQCAHSDTTPQTWSGS